jgi:hypothetical protein
MSIKEFICPPELQRFARFQPKQLGPTPENLRELEQLLREIWSKKSGKTDTDQKILTLFQVLCGLDPDLVSEREQRLLQLLDKKQPVLVGLQPDNEYQPNASCTLCAVIVNPTAKMFREIRIRFQSPDLTFADNGQPKPIKLLESHDEVSVPLAYQAPTQPMLTSLSLEIDVCDHRGEWRAYKSRFHVLLNFLETKSGFQVKIRATHTTHTRPSVGMLASSQTIEPNVRSATSAKGALAHSKTSSPNSRHKQSMLLLEKLLLVELELEAQLTRRLQAKALHQKRSLSRGTRLTRAVLHNQNPAHAPERIELVSCPFMVFGRYNEATNTGFGDFALGFIPEYGKISRFQCAVCAKGEGLAIMQVSANEHSYTALNAEKLSRGHWQPLISSDVLDICGLYKLTVTLAPDAAPQLSPLDEAVLRSETLSVHLLQIVDLLKSSQAIDSRIKKQKLKTCYQDFVQQQNKAAELNGTDSSGPLLYARFQPDNSCQRRVVHIYLPKCLPLGSSQHAGLHINAEGVALYHAELHYKQGMYWIQNRARRGDVRVCSHDLEPYEAIPLEEGDTVTVGTAQFVFASS